MLAPILVFVLTPIGLIGSAGLDVRLVKSTIENPTKKEKYEITNLQGKLQSKIYDLKRAKDGSLTLDIQAVTI